MNKHVWDHSLQSKYEMTSLGPLQKFLGIQFVQTRVCAFPTDYRMLNTPPTYVPISSSIHLSKETRTEPVNAHQYQCIVGELNYLTKTCWEIGFAISILSRYTFNYRVNGIKDDLSPLWPLSLYTCSLDSSTVESVHSLIKRQNSHF